MKLLAIGEVMAEISGDAESGFSVGFAGDTYNTAVYCARALGEAGGVGFMTRVGPDPLSAAMIERLRDEGISDTKIGFDEHRNLGIYSVTTDDEGERSFHYWRNQSAARGLFSDEADLGQLADAEIIYLSAITLAILSPSARQRLADRLAALRDHGSALIAFDSNYRPKLWEDVETARSVTSQFWSLAHIALPSIDDEMSLYDETAEQVVARFSKRDWKACAIKRGAIGPLSPTLSPRDRPEFSPVDNVVDTTSAGDSFNAGYLAAFLTGEDEATCLMSGHNLASKVVQIQGAIAPRTSI